MEDTWKLREPFTVLNTVDRVGVIEGRRELASNGDAKSRTTIMLEGFSVAFRQGVRLCRRRYILFIRM